MNTTGETFSYTSAEVTTDNSTMAMPERYLYVMVRSVLITMGALAGLVGNSLVIVVFGVKKKRERTSSSVFMVMMGVVDALICCFIMPWNVAMFYVPQSYALVPRVTFHICASWSVYSTMLMCVTIAFDRYFSICKPCSVIFNYKRAKVICAAVAGISLILSVMAVIPPRWIGTPQAAISMFVMTVSVVLVLYSLVWRAIRRLSTVRVGDLTRRPIVVAMKAQDLPCCSHEGHINNVENLPDQSSSSLNTKGARSIPITASLKSASSVSIVPVPPSIIVTESSVTTSRHEESMQRAKKAAAVRSAIMFCSVAVVFILSWAPSLLYGLGVRSATEYLRSIIFSNNVINPLIYYFLNKRFAKEVGKLVKCQFN